MPLGLMIVLALGSLEERVYDCLVHADDSLGTASAPARLTESNLLECTDRIMASNRSKCALECTASAIGVYWACAAVCVEKQAPTTCITAGCPAAVAAFDVPCLKRCNQNTQGQERDGSCQDIRHEDLGAGEVCPSDRASCEYMPGRTECCTSGESCIPKVGCRC